MRKYLNIVTVTLLCMCCFTSLAQEAGSTFKERLVLGGNLGASFGNYTSIVIAPTVGYIVSPQLMTGIGVNYQYTKDKRYSPSQSFNNYGFMAWGQYLIIPQLYAHAEFDMFNYQRLQNLSGDKTRDWVPHLYLGGGYRQYISPKTFINAQVLFDVINDKNSPYSDWEPQFSIGVGTSF